jgi:hypothetical protein
MDELKCVVKHGWGGLSKVEGARSGDFAGVRAARHCALALPLPCMGELDDANRLALRQGTQGMEVSH